MVTAKGAAGGYFPFGWMAARGDQVELVRQELGDFNHGGTFSHHAVGAAAGLATLRIIQDEGLVENSARMGALLGAELRAALGDHQLVGDIRGRGLFWALELVADRRSKAPFPARDHVCWRLWKRAFERGLVTYYSEGCADGVNGDLLMLGPPLIVDEGQVREMVAILAAAFADPL
jgi:adenosylmethionine-8-amino-7-oxononanoate aminotransferase